MKTLSTATDIKGMQYHDEHDNEWTVI